VVVPSWQLTTEYGYTRGTYRLPHIGHVTIVEEDDDVLIKPRLYRLPQPHIEALAEIPTAVAA